ncbi:hypothetical protein [Weissella paramesenteroides]|uniref:hypothetical protein n=1 Tax=Weissella paramesenteroides TaxID=1249 RepID=UPI0018DA7BAB|nr:hypothetical protein [Weissella paramesenteroides]QPI46654.1 hypothetical protein I2E55_01730 [Weissella paramesenteroides]
MSKSLKTIKKNIDELIKREQENNSEIDEFKKQMAFKEERIASSDVGMVEKVTLQKQLMDDKDTLNIILRGKAEKGIKAFESDPIRNDLQELATEELEPLRLEAYKAMREFISVAKKYTTAVADKDNEYRLLYNQMEDYNTHSQDRRERSGHFLENIVKPDFNVKNVLDRAENKLNG